MTIRQVQSTVTVAAPETRTRRRPRSHKGRSWILPLAARGRPRSARPTCRVLAGQALNNVLTGSSPVGTDNA